MRLAIAGVSERDIDLLLLEEFQSNARFQKWFLQQIFGGATDFTELLSARRSVTQIVGESDLEVIFSNASGGKVSFLIENKVNAGFQPQQAERYHARGRSYLARGECSTYCTVVIAPSRYFGAGTATAKGFDKCLTYESLLGWFKDASDLGERRFYKIALLSSAIDKGTLGYQPEEDKPVTEFWRAYWRHATELAPELEMKEPLSKAARAAFIYFRPPALPRGVEICHKVVKGYVDLQIKGYGDRLNEIRGRLEGRLEKGMRLTRAGVSAALRIGVPVLNTGLPFRDQMSAATAGIQAAQNLLRWHMENKPIAPNPRPHAGARKSGARR